MPDLPGPWRTFVKNSFDNVWFPFTCSEDLAQYPPLVLERGEGVWLYDANSRRLLDAIGSWWVSVLGHNHPRISKAVREQLDRLEHVLMAGCIAPPTMELADMLSSMAPGARKRVFFSDDGSTSVEVALKMALQYWANKNVGKTEFVALSGAYHGDTLGAMSVGGIPAFQSLFQDRFKRFYLTDPPYCYRCPCGNNTATCEAQCMDSLERLLSQKAGSIAACIFEPMVQGAAGMRIYPAKALKRIFSLCQRFGVITIADEVATGFGRTGRMFACEHAGEAPDIMCVAKGLTGGYLPMAATIAQEKIYGEFRGDFLAGRELMHGHTFTGNPLAAAAAVETLKILKERNIPASLAEKAGFFRKGLERFLELDIVGDVRSIGMIGAIELVRDRRTKEKFPREMRVAFHTARKALDYGVLMRPLGDILYFIPAYIISEEEMEMMFNATMKSIKDVIAGKGMNSGTIISL
jgi:adenosylmethionine---8-amino-7-oxononanoate aminotransferase